MSKRLALLHLPAEGLQAVADGRITTSAAEQLLKLRSHPEILARLVEEIVEDLPDPSADPDELDPDGPLDARDVQWEVDRALQAIQYQKRIEQTHETLTEQGIPVLTDTEIKDRFGRDRHQRQLYRDEDIQKAGEAGDLVAGLGYTGEPIYYTTGDIPRSRASGSDHAARQREEDKQRTTAMKARAEACTTLVKTLPSKEILMAALVKATLGRQTDAEALRLAHGWLRSHDIGPASTEGDARPDHYGYEKAVAGSDDTKLQQHLAYAMAIATREVRARANWRPWDREDREYLQLLIDKTDYRPTAWEEARLATDDTEDENENA